MSVPLAVDATRALRLRGLGYAVHTQLIPADITQAGRIGLVSKSGTLTYQMMYELRDFGFSTAVGIGGDPIIGTTHIDCLQAFEDDPETAALAAAYLAWFIPADAPK